MKSLSIVLLTLVVCFSSCSARHEARQAQNAEVIDSLKKTAEQPVAGNFRSSLGEAEKISLEAAVDRKIIRNADLTIEVSSTTQAQQQVTSIAELNGGFVVTSEAKQRENTDPDKRTVDVKLVVRIPSTQFNSALQEIEKLATNMPVRNVTGQDVTEEFIDLEARIKTQKALEVQFLEIMRQAHKVEDALEVQRQIAEVRTEIEKLEGRKRFLENRSSLSTITVNIQTPIPIVVSTSGFRHTVREAASESVELATGMVLFLVRFLIVMTPIFLFVILPLSLLALYFKRRAVRIRLAHKLEAAAAANPS
jgi:hypothetical protein